MYALGDWGLLHLSPISLLNKRTLTFSPPPGEHSRLTPVCSTARRRRPGSQTMSILIFALIVLIVAALIAWAVQK